MQCNIKIFSQIFRLKVFLIYSFRNFHIWHCENRCKVRGPTELVLRRPRSSFLSIYCYFLPGIIDLVFFRLVCGPFSCWRVRYGKKRVKDIYLPKNPYFVIKFIACVSSKIMEFVRKGNKFYAQFVHVVKLHPAVFGNDFLTQPP
jgi:hypothetical protein